MRIQYFLHGVAVALIASFAISSAPSQAGGRDCGWHCFDDNSDSSYHRTYLRRIEVERGVYEIARKPSRYGWVKTRVRINGRYKWRKKRVLLRPYKNIAIYRRPHHKYVWERVTIHPERDSWGSGSEYGAKDW